MKMIVTGCGVFIGSNLWRVSIDQTNCNDMYGNR